MGKYIIKNCPAIYGDEYCKENTYEDGSIYCKDCTNCVLKQIVEKCMEDWEDMTTDRFQRELLDLLDILEVE